MRLPTNRHIFFQQHLQAGVSLIELLVIIAIIAIIGTIGASSLIRYSEAQTYNAGVAETMTLLATAKSYAQSQVKPNCTGRLFGYRVSLSAPRTMTINAVCGDTYATLTHGTAMITKTLPANVSFSSSTGIIFHALTGNVGTNTGLATADMTVMITGYNREQSITVNPVGQISLGRIVVR